MLVAYMDESGFHSDSLAFVLAGFVADERQWARFSREWERTLTKWGIDHFHAADFFNGSPQFEGFNASQKKLLPQALISIMASCKLVGISQGIDLRAFRDIVTGALLRKIESPYILCFQMLMAHIDRISAELGLSKDEEIAFVFDQQQQFSGRALQVHNKLKTDGFGTHLGSITFDSKKKFLPLQAADFLAYETYRELCRKLDRPERDVRQSLVRLFVKVPLDGGYSDRAALTALAEAEMPNEAQA